MKRKTKNGNYKLVEKYIGKKGGMSSVASGAAMGAVIGAAIGAAGAYAFVDTNRRKMLADRMYSLKDYAAEAVNEYTKNGHAMAMNMTKQSPKGRKNGRSKKKAESKIK